MTTTAAIREDQFLRTAPLADIIADNHRRNASAPKPPLAGTRQMFEQLAEWAHNNTDDDGLDLIIDAVAALTPHLEREESAAYFEDLMTAIVALGQAEEGEHPGDIDGETWRDQCRDAVEFAAEKLAGAR